MLVWPAEHLAAIGRPLQRWDVCPTCGQTASTHVFNVVAQELRCPGDIAKATYLDKGDYEKELFRQESQAREIEQRERILKDRRAKLEATAARTEKRAQEITGRREGPALDVGAKRAYFEE